MINAQFAKYNTTIIIITRRMKARHLSLHSGLFQALNGVVLRAASDCVSLVEKLTGVGSVAVRFRRRSRLQIHISWTSIFLCNRVSHPVAEKDVNTFSTTYSG